MGRSVGAGRPKWFEASGPTRLAGTGPGRVRYRGETCRRNRAAILIIVVGERADGESSCVPPCCGSSAFRSRSSCCWPIAPATYDLLRPVTRGPGPRRPPQDGHPAVGRNPISTNAPGASSNRRPRRSPESAKGLFSFVVGNGFNLTVSTAPDRRRLDLPSRAGLTIDAAQ